jgi:IS5 family transposase
MLVQSSVERLKDAVYDSYAVRSFMGINFFDEQVPDATTLLNFRHLLETHNIGKVFFDAVAHTLEKGGHMMHGGSMVHATLISAPSSTKNEKRERNPEMHHGKSRLNGANRRCAARLSIHS